MTEALVAEVFDLAARVVPDPVAGTPMVIPLGRHAGALSRRGRTSDSPEQALG